MDEGGGYYDTGYVQPLDFFGSGSRIPLIVVSNYRKGGHISHTYTDHVSILKFIEANWNVPPITKRSRDNLPNPVVGADAYKPTNGPAIGDLMDPFNFKSSNRSGPNKYRRRRCRTGANHCRLHRCSPSPISREMEGHPQGYGCLRLGDR